ncbi:Polyamine ABC transporter permease [Pseudomonas amygdali pv. eriobotryae]|uniref:Polyamine ABC transporter permease n=4 Tax=Pseudomonas syringae group genomosp. 2 TaxID=251698 RepID=A0A0N8RG72_PSEA0|nr:Polyamine ABC transporter permease [Pseudomonas amygdali pv. eriobotryae]
MAIAVPLTEGASPNLKQRLARAERVNRWKAQALIAPLVIFLLLVFLVPIAALLYKSVGNPEVVTALPTTVVEVQKWDGKGLPPESVYKAMSLDLAETRKNSTLGDLSKRLNMELAGYRSLLSKTARALPFKTEPASYKEALEGLDERWGDPAYWQAVRRNTSSITPYYLLAAVDHRIDDLGEVAPATPDQAIYLDIFARTFWMGLVITAICLVLAYPLAYLLASLPARQSNLLMILVLLPFWTSILVRVAAWIVLLQSSGLINSALLAMGIIDKPLELVFNRVGVYISMVHIMLPFMILPLYANLVKHDTSLLEAASDLGSSTFNSFWKITVPLSKNGVIAGCMLVFIPVVGEFVIPELLGGPETLMIGRVLWQEFFSNRDWPVASALAVIMLLVLIVPIILFNRSQAKELEGKA